MKDFKEMAQEFWRQAEPMTRNALREAVKSNSHAPYVRQMIAQSVEESGLRDDLSVEEEQELLTMIIALARWCRERKTYSFVLSNEANELISEYQQLIEVGSRSDAVNSLLLLVKDAKFLNALDIIGKEV